MYGYDKYPYPHDPRYDPYARPCHDPCDDPCDQPCNDPCHDPCCLEGPTGPTGPTGPAGPGGGLQNLVDGNNTGAVRGIGTPNNYIMGEYAVALNSSAEASGNSAYAQGISNISAGMASHAEGLANTATGNFAHVEGVDNSDGGFIGAHVMGISGVADTPYSWFLGNGAIFFQGLAAKILYTGDAFIDNAWNGGGADYAEMYETESGQPIEPGYFVTFAGTGKKIRLAQAYDKYILGVVSAAPGFLAGSGELRWKGKFKTDEWGRVVYEDVTVPEVKDKQGGVAAPARTESRPALNPAYDGTRAYVSRQKRPEWVKIALLGAVRVRDDGTLTSGGYCMPGMNGIAAAAHEGYRVLERTGANQALILFR